MCNLHYLVVKAPYILHHNKIRNSNCDFQEWDIQTKVSIFTNLYDKSRLALAFFRESCFQTHLQKAHKGYLIVTEYVIMDLPFTIFLFVNTDPPGKNGCDN